MTLFPPIVTGEAAAYAVSLPIRGDSYRRASEQDLASLERVSSATACALLRRFGYRRTFIRGPQPLRPGMRAVGLARTLQFMPLREDVLDVGEQEYIERRTALWAVLEAVEPGDILVVQAFGDPDTGCLGEMLLRYLEHRGGRAAVVDGAVRDVPRLKGLDLGVWAVHKTPHYASQSDLFPWAYDVPVAVGGALVLPGDAIVADDDGAVVIPSSAISRIVDAMNEHEDWEDFSRQRIAEGGRLSTYYPLDETGRAEYDAYLNQER